MGQIFPGVKTPERNGGISPATQKAVEAPPSEGPLHLFYENGDALEIEEQVVDHSSSLLLESSPQPNRLSISNQAEVALSASSPLSFDSTNSLPQESTTGSKEKSSKSSPQAEEVQEDVLSDRRQESLDAALQFCLEAQREWEEENPDNAIEILDRAYEFLVSVDPDDDVNLLQQKEDLRFLISKRIVEIYASRQNAVNGSHTEIPLIMNEHVKKEIDSFLGRERRCFLEAYKRSGLYRTMILKELAEAGLPDKLCWLPLIESHFKQRALSRARALGLWQFIPSTGYKFGLMRDKWVDERMDPLKSTRAAIEYLRQLHKIFGDWNTVLAAYNCGEGKVLKVIRSQHLKYLDNFWDLYERLPRETARYVPRFLAAIQIIENPDQFGIELGDPLPPLEYEEITCHKQIQLKRLAEKLDLKESDLTELNPELRYAVTPNHEYRLKVPSDQGEKTLACLESIPEWTPPKPDYLIVRIKRGETLSLLARRYGSSVSGIMRANRITRADRVRAGQKLRIPLRGKRRDYSSVAGGSSSGVETYRVQKGDCPSTIAKDHNMRLTEFLSLNGLKINSLLYPGQRVLVRNN
ncbi:MAG: transglycosylase SLT domain-containing protein [bacterium]